jgi:peptide-methionine (S)-S-oxide reductase
MRGIETALGGAGRSDVHFRHYAINARAPRGRFGCGHARACAFGYSKAMNNQGTSMNQQAGTEVAILGGGCFWCLEAVYLEARGVTRVESGYMGGASADPTYEQVCAGTTGHAEVVRLEFDPNVISYRDILEIFFTIHDPTTLNRQGNDVGTQYRSVIFTTSPEQEATARKVMAEMAGVWDAPIVTQLLPEETWYKAEDYHQNYFAQHPLQGYCAFVVAPKVAKFRKTFAERMK